jgi:hypothetical protein
VRGGDGELFEARWRSGEGATAGSPLWSVGAVGPSHLCFVRAGRARIAVGGQQVQKWKRGHDWTDSPSVQDNLRIDPIEAFRLRLEDEGPLTSGHPGAYIRPATRY